MPAQTLAHRGWAGSGLSQDPWWRDSVFYEVNPDQLTSEKAAGDIGSAAAAQPLDSLKSLGVDALVLTPFELHLGAAGSAAQASAELAREDALDSLLNEAGSRHLRILVDLPLGKESPETTLATARSSLGRGVAGLRLTLSRAARETAEASPADLVHLVRELRAICAEYAGERVLLWDSEIPFATLVDRTAASRQQATLPRAVSRRGGAPRSPSRNAPAVRPADSLAIKARGPQLVVDYSLSQFKAISSVELRAILLQAGLDNPSEHTVRVLASDALPMDSDARRSSGSAGAAQTTGMAKALAAVLFTTPAVPMLSSGQELGVGLAAAGATTPANGVWDSARGSLSGADTSVADEDARPGSVLNFIRLLSRLRHSNSTLRDGTFRLLTIDQPGIVGWVRIGHGSGPSARPIAVVLNLSAEAQVVPLDAVLEAAGLQVPHDSLMHTLATSRAPAPDGIVRSSSTASVSLEPYGVFIGELRVQALARAAHTRHTRRRRR